MQTLKTENLFSPATPRQPTPPRKSVSKTVNTILLCNFIWLIMINIIIDNDKSPKIRINLRFPASFGCFIFHPPNTGSGPAKSG